MDVSNPEFTLERVSPCTIIRTDAAYAQNPTAVFSPSTSFSTLNTRLAPPFCLGVYFRALPTNDAPLLYIYNATANIIGSIDVDSLGITFSLLGASAFFPGDFQDGTANFQQLQFCANGTHIELYSDCSNLLRTEAFALTEGAPDNGLISLFRPLTNDTPTFLVCLIYPWFNSSLDYTFLYYNLIGRNSAAIRGRVSGTYLRNANHCPVHSTPSRLH